MEKLNAWNTYDLSAQEACMAFAEDYKHFLDAGKTERECVDFFVGEAEKNGYIELGRAITEKKQLKAGDCVYSVWMNKSMVLFRIGEKPFEEGMNILGAHIDSPRLDVKQVPLYEDGGIGYLDTHYYGGIKKYQYVTLPLALHGVVVKKTGETTIVSIGEEEDDPVFFISDLLPHLAQEQMKKNASTFIEGEALDLIIGSQPVVIDADTKPVKKGENSEKEDGDAEKKSGEKNTVTKALLKILKDVYGIEEEDFISAELEIVPAGKARDAGLDRSMVLAYGQDDRVCAYPSFRAQMEVEDIARTSCTLLVDKEEIGSVGATGMQSRFFENALAEVMQLCGQYSELALRRTLANSAMLSSDVSAAFDPSYGSAFEKKNSCFLGGGMVFNKFTGARGKSGSNDANAEYLGALRKVMEDGDVLFQTAELGKVDLGGGGTIAYILALYGMNVIDSGVPVLSMHAPWEATSKADLYEAYKGYKAFFRKMDMRNM
ncbi:MAG: aminopeptidase [Eubacteriales bacterium]|nr:aminopeptidase [Eubacteriales bacterium]